MSGIRLLVVGSVSLQLSARSIGLFEAFYSSLKPVVVLSQEFEVCPSGKFAAGVTEIPFEFDLKANPGEELFDTYHGVYVNVQYNITANMTRSAGRAGQGGSSGGIAPEQARSFIVTVALSLLTRCFCMLCSSCPFPSCPAA